MTNITILNDHWPWIEENPETFMKAIKYGMNSGSDEELQTHYHPIEEVEEANRHYVTVHKAEHADIDQVILSGGNSAYPVHELAFGKARQWITRWGPSSNNARVRIGILRSIVRKLRWHADRLEAEVDTIAAELTDNSP